MDHLQPEFYEHPNHLIQQRLLRCGLLARWHARCHRRLGRLRPRVERDHPHQRPLSQRHFWGRRHQRRLVP